MTGDTRHACDMAGDEGTRWVAYLQFCQGCFKDADEIMTAIRVPVIAGDLQGSERDRCVCVCVLGEGHRWR